jgi:quinol monooxygenase YgiN
VIVLAARIRAKAGEEEGLAHALAQLAPPSRAEAGCYVYEVNRDRTDPRVFFVFERWADQESLDAHQQSEHFERWAVNDLRARIESAERLELESLA